MAERHDQKTLADRLRLWAVALLFLCAAIVSRAAEPEDGGSPVCVALRTNLLCDAAGVPDVGAECLFKGANVSVVGHWMYAWWGSPRHHHLWRIYGGDIGARYWFGDKPLTGHHVGSYVGMLTFDFQFGGKGWIAGRPGHSIWDRLMLNAGIEYGYSLPIARSLSLDFSLGLGYMGGTMEKYVVKDGVNTWDSTVKKTWIGPSKVEVTLVWLIGAQKGGRR